MISSLILPRNCTIFCFNAKLTLTFWTIEPSGISLSSTQPSQDGEQIALSLEPINQRNGPIRYAWLFFTRLLAGNYIQIFVLCSLILFEIITTHTFEELVGGTELENCLD